MALEGRACRSGSVEAGSVTARWDRSATQSCIYETLPGHCCTPELRSSYQAYREHRSRWPLRAVVWEVLFASQLTRLAAAILRELAPGASGAGPVLYNDQVGACCCRCWHLKAAIRCPWLTDAASQVCVVTLPSSPSSSTPPPLPLQYILKPPGEPLSSFAWHRDSDWCRSEEVDYAPYISGAAGGLGGGGPAEVGR